MRPGPNGWEMQDLGDLPRDFQQWFGTNRSGSRSGGGSFFKRDSEESPPDHARRVGKDGETIDVRQRKDGKIEVRREKRTTHGSGRRRHEFECCRESVFERRRVAESGS